MIWMLVIADDLTGALDTGVQFSGQGISTRVGTAQVLKENQISPEINILVLNMETRYLDPGEAYDRVKEVVLWAREKDIRIIYKKTDSVLRGNIGSELTAVLDASGSKSLYFIPAFPKMKRYTIQGIQYLGDTPLSETELGRDVFDPVSCSYIPEIIRQQSLCNTSTVKRDEKIADKLTEEAEKTIYICDACTEEDMKTRLLELEQINELKVLAGCAGCAESLAEMIRIKINASFYETKAERILISCGSLNTVTEKQLDYLQTKGIPRVHLTEELKTTMNSYQEKEGRNLIHTLEQMLRTDKSVILDTFNEEGGKNFMPGLRFEIARYHGIIAKELIERKCVDIILMMGGDTLMGFMKEIHCSSINPVCELRKGVVLSNLIYKGEVIQIISKSGGFGNETLLYEILEETKRRFQM